jgi:hypothetical protein
MRAPEPPSGWHGPFVPWSHPYQAVKRTVGFRDPCMDRAVGGKSRENDGSLAFT